MGTTAASNMVTMESAPMSIFLLIAGIANLSFLWRTVRDNTGDSSSGPNRFLLFLASAELCWVIPGFVQCFVIFLDGNNGAWSPQQAESGCDIQGFYSVFSATIGQLLGAYGAYIAVQQGQVPTSTATLCCTFIFVPVAYGLASAASDSKLSLIIFPLGFWSGWLLWPVASGYGLAESPIPDHMLISGAVMGHLQALLNPLLYGIYWRARFAVRCPETSNATAQLVLVVGEHEKSGLKYKKSEALSVLEHSKDESL